MSEGYLKNVKPEASEVAPYLAAAQSETYPPADPTDWFCIRGRSVIIVSDAEMTYILNQRHDSTNLPHIPVR